MLRSVKIIFCVCWIIAFSGNYARSQERPLDSLHAKFNTYRNRNFSEKIFLHTDQSTYFTGETLWMNMYQVDASFHKPIDWSQVVYVELIGRDKKAVLQRKFLLDKHVTTGSVFLPASLSSGNYELRAYTSWMKNFDADYFFHQNIRIINPFVELSREDKKPAPQYDVQFFPEGGRLVYGLESVVGFRVVDKNGLGVNVKGFILNHTNDTLVRFSPFKFGLGKFSFTPEQNEVYTVLIVDSQQKKFVHSLPQIASAGYVMQVSELMNKIRVTVKSSDTTLNQPIYLLAHTRHILALTEKQVLKKGEAVFMIDKKALYEGVSHLTLFTADLKPIAERLFFTIPIHKVTIETNLSQSVVTTRQKVSIDVLVQQNKLPVVFSNASAVVFKADSLDLPVDNVVNYLWLTSDLRGRIENPEYYFGGENREKNEAVDNLMLTHGWRRFRWENILSGTDEVKYVPELNGHVVSGKIINGMNGAPMNRVAAYLTFSGTPINLYVSRSDSLGHIMFETQNLKGSKNLIVQAEDRSAGGYQIELNDPFSTSQSTFPILEFILAKELKTNVEQRNIHMQVHNLFHEHAALPVKSTVSTDGNFYGKPDEHYRLDDYTRFPTLEEVMREYVPGVRVKKAKDGFHLSNLDMVNKSPFSGEPIVLLDGVPVFDMNKLMEVDPLKVKELDVVTKRYYLQAASFDGVVSLTSYTGDLAGFQLPAHALLTSYQGLEEQWDFFTPRYETDKETSSTVPDTRYVLFRSPNGLAAKGSHFNLDFFTSDITGHYKIVIQGITHDGLPGYTETTFTVK